MSNVHVIQSRDLFALSVMTQINENIEIKKIHDKKNEITNTEPLKGVVKEYFYPEPTNLRRPI